MDAALNERIDTETGGLIAVPVEPSGVWSALRELRRAMRALGSPSLERLVGIDAEGRPVSGPQIAERAHVLILGFGPVGSTEGLD